MPVQDGAIHLRVAADGLEYAFEFSLNGSQWQRAGNAVDGSRLSPSILKGFNYTGVFIGLYASANGGADGNFADFDFFDLQHSTNKPSGDARQPDRPANQ